MKYTIRDSRGIHWLSQDQPYFSGIKILQVTSDLSDAYIADTKERADAHGRGASLIERPKQQHGGRRPNSGPKPIAADTKRVCFILPRDLAAWLAANGGRKIIIEAIRRLMPE